MTYLYFPLTKNAVDSCHILVARILARQRLFIHTTTISHRTHYEVLGVSSTATPKEIKAAFYKKSKELHPDNCPDGNPSGFVELKTAYDILRRPADRRAYDNRGIRTYQNIYNPGGYHQHSTPYDDSAGWQQFWRENPADNIKSTQAREKSEREWRRAVLKWMALGFSIVLIYNVGYVLMLYVKQRQLSQMVDKDEIARSFLRQSEYKNREKDDLEFESLTRILKSDVDDAWKRKNEEFGVKNQEEIREEYRWMRAVQDADQHRRIKAKRAEERRQHHVDFIWNKKQEDDK